MGIGYAYFDMGLCCVLRGNDITNDVSAYEIFRHCFLSIIRKYLQKENWYTRKEDIYNYKFIVW